MCRNIEIYGLYPHVRFRGRLFEKKKEIVDNHALCLMTDYAVLLWHRQTQGVDNPSVRKSSKRPREPVLT
jgi:hypothetical protein